MACPIWSREEPVDQGDDEETYEDHRCVIEVSRCLLHVTVELVRNQEENGRDKEPDHRDPPDDLRERPQVECALLERAAGDRQPEDDWERVGYLIAYRSNASYR